ncbi:hypothetical protein BGU93_19315, partial [Clostridioides difficile]
HQQTADGKSRTQQWAIEASVQLLKQGMGASFGQIQSWSLYGATHTKENAHQLFAMAIDSDYVGLQQLKTMLKQFGNGVQLCPTFLVSSGKGGHLYYLLNEPGERAANREKTLSAVTGDFLGRQWTEQSPLWPERPDIARGTCSFR